MGKPDLWPRLALVAGSQVVTYDFASHTHTHTVDIGVSAIGGGTVSLCP